MNPSKKKSLIELSVWITRTLLGLVFIFSGFVKSVDPMGTLFKIQEYCVALGLDVLPALQKIGAVGLCCGEFLLGVFLFTGCYRKTTPRITMCLMVILLPLTVWIYISDPISDCGCFGDALVLSNSATMWKNVVITLLDAWLIVYNRKVRCLIRPAIQWMALVVSAVYIIAIALIGYNYQPLIDFRQYKIGTSLLSDDSDLSLWSEDGMNDMTDDVLVNTGHQVILFMPSIRDIPLSSTWVINSLSRYCDEKGINFIAVSGGDAAEISEWKDFSMPDYPIYTSDQSTMRTVVRGNPAIVETRDGIIIWKGALASLRFNPELFQSIYDGTKEPFALSNRALLYTLSGLWLAIMLFLTSFVVIRFTPKNGHGSVDLLGEKETDHLMAESHPGEGEQ